MPIQHDNSFHESLSTLFTTPTDKVGAVVSVSMIASPIWLSHIKPVSDLAALLAPILGCIYLSLQIGFKLVDRMGKK